MLCLLLFIFSFPFREVCLESAECVFCQHAENYFDKQNAAFPYEFSVPRCYMYEKFNTDFSKRHRFYEVLMHFYVCIVSTTLTTCNSFVFFSTRHIKKELKNKWEISKVLKILVGALNGPKNKKKVNKNSTFPDQFLQGERKLEWISFHLLKLKYK